MISLVQEAVWIFFQKACFSSCLKRMILQHLARCFSKVFEATSAAGVLTVALASSSYYFCKKRNYKSYKEFQFFFQKFELLEVLEDSVDCEISSSCKQSHFLWQIKYSKKRLERQTTFQKFQNQKINKLFSTSYLLLFAIIVW